MLLRRVIPCLDVDKGRVVKGVEFVNLRDAGDPVELAVRYQDEGADEIVFLDITASHERRETVAELARRNPAPEDGEFTADELASALAESRGRRTETRVEEAITRTRAQDLVDEVAGNDENGSDRLLLGHLNHRLSDIGRAGPTCR